MRSRLCFAWFGDDGGGGSQRAERRPAKPHNDVLFHDGRKWVLKRDGKIVAESKSTFAMGDLKARERDR